MFLLNSITLNKNGLDEIFSLKKRLIVMKLVTIQIKWENAASRDDWGEKRVNVSAPLLK